MKKINHPYLVQKDLHEFWSSEWGWLHIGDLVQIAPTRTWDGRYTPKVFGMVIGFFYDPHTDDTAVAVHPASEPCEVWFYDADRCSPAGAQ